MADNRKNFTNVLARSRVVDSGNTSAFYGRTAPLANDLFWSKPPPGTIVVPRAQLALNSFAPTVSDGILPITATNLVPFGSGLIWSSGTTTSSASITTVTGRFYVISAALYDLSNNLEALTSVGNALGITWTTITHTNNCYLFYGYCTSGSTGTLTFTRPGTGINRRLFYSIDEFQNVAQTGSVVQSSATASVTILQSASVTLTPTLSSFANTKNATFVYATLTTNQPASPLSCDVEAGYTELSKETSSSFRGITGFNVNNDTSPSITYGSSGFSTNKIYSGISIELKQENYTANQTVSVPAATLTLNAIAPTVVASGGSGITVSVPVSTLSLTSFVPTVRTPRTIQVPAATLTLNAIAPTVITPRTVFVPVSTLSLTSFAPTINVSSANTVSVPAAALTLNAIAPTVALSNNRTVSVPAAALTLNAIAPTVITPRTVFVPVSTLTLNAVAPTVALSNNRTVSVPVSTLTLIAFVPTVLAGATQQLKGGKRKRYSDNPKLQELLDKGVIPYEVEAAKPVEQKTVEKPKVSRIEVEYQAPVFDYAKYYAEQAKTAELLNNYELSNNADATAIQALIDKRKKDDEAIALLLLL
jgi:hypothetical protein